MAPHRHADAPPSAGARHPGEGRLSGGRILLVDGHPEADRVADVLARSGGFEVDRADEPAEAMGHLLSAPYDLVLVDPDAGVGRGCELVRQTRNLAPGTPVAALSSAGAPAARIDCGRTVPTLERSAGEVELLVRTHRLIDAARLPQAVPAERVLAVGAHPDDVEIGVGGALLAHGAAGDAVNILTLSRGAAGGDTDRRVAESQVAAALLGARLFMEGLEDTRIPSGHPTVELIEEVVARVRPTVIYTHSRNDTHQDHRAVHEATMVAARSVARIACYQAPSATVDFRPNRFVPIADYVEGKQRAVAAFASQAGRPYLQPEVISSNARYWGRFAHASHAEALEVVRDSTSLAHPSTHSDPVPAIREDADVAS